MVNKRVLELCITFFLYLLIMHADADHVEEIMHLEQNGNCNASEILRYQMFEEKAEKVLLHQNGIIKTGNDIVVSGGKDLLKLFLQLAQSVGLSCFIAFLVK